MIRQNTGIERIRRLFTGMRLYRCRDCDISFRAPDRRRVAREGALDAGVATKHVA